jgi:hypothetical protein
MAIPDTINRRIDTSAATASAHNDAEPALHDGIECVLLAKRAMNSIMPRFTSHATHGAYQLQKKSIHGRARYTRDITVTQCWFRGNLGVICNMVSQAI